MDHDYVRKCNPYEEKVFTSEEKFRIYHEQQQLDKIEDILKKLPTNIQKPLKKKLKTILANLEMSKKKHTELEKSFLLKKMQLQN